MKLALKHLFQIILIIILIAIIIVHPPRPAGAGAGAGKRSGAPAGGSRRIPPCALRGSACRTALETHVLIKEETVSVVVAAVNQCREIKRLVGCKDPIGPAPLPLLISNGVAEGGVLARVGHGAQAVLPIAGHGNLLLCHGSNLAVDKKEGAGAGAGAERACERVSV